MPEYHVLRAVAALMAAGVATQSRGSLRWYFWLQAVFSGVPAWVESDAWKLYCLVPLVMATGVAATVVTIMGLWRSAVSGRERGLLLAWCGCMGGALALSGWIWAPERWFQALMLGRQYGLLALAAGGTAGWCYLRHLRPLAAITGASCWWCCWLWVSFGLSATTKGGLLWSIVPWDGGLPWWRGVSGVGLVFQIVLMATALNLRGRSREPLPGARGPAYPPA